MIQKMWFAAFKKNDKERNWLRGLPMERNRVTKKRGIVTTIMYSLE